MAEARETEAKIARGEEVGPLAGLPFGVKELDDLAGFPSTHASLPYKDNYPSGDSVEVERLRNAGAIALGKTNSPSSDTPLSPRTSSTASPVTPGIQSAHLGGSSGGSSASVSSGQTPFCTGSDGGGSIRIPCCWTGLFGMKVSFGRILIAPRECSAGGDTSVHGPMVHTVRDAAMYIDVTTGTHEADPNSLPHPLQVRGRPRESAIQTAHRLEPHSGLRRARARRQRGSASPPSRPSATWATKWMRPTTSSTTPAPSGAHRRDRDPRLHRRQARRRSP